MCISNFEPIRIKPLSFRTAKRPLFLAHVDKPKVTGPVSSADLGQKKTWLDIVLTSIVPYLGYIISSIHLLQQRSPSPAFDSLFSWLKLSVTWPLWACFDILLSIHSSVWNVLACILRNPLFLFLNLPSCQSINLSARQTDRQISQHIIIHVWSGCA